MNLYQERIAFAVIFVFLESIIYVSEGGLFGVVGTFTQIFLLFLSSRHGLNEFKFRYILVIIFMYGEWANVLDTEPFVSFYSLRLLGFSFSSLIIFLLILFIRKVNIYLALLVTYIFIISVFYAVLGSFEPASLLVRDIFYVAQLIIVLIFIMSIDFEYDMLIKLLLRIGILQLIISFVLGARFDYGVADLYLPMSAAGYSIFILLGMATSLKMSERVAYFIILISLIFTGDVLLTGKFIILMILGIVGMVYSAKISFKLVLAIAIVWIAPILYQSFDSMAHYKFGQIMSFFEVINLNELAIVRTSIGNLIAELLTIIQYFYENPAVFLFGHGASGTGIPDYFGYLNLWVGFGGYDVEQATHNSFIRFHLAFYNYILKLGFIGMAAIIFIIIKKSAFSMNLILSLSLFLFISDANFETFMLSIVLIRALMLLNNASLPRKYKIESG